MFKAIREQRKKELKEEIKKELIEELMQELKEELKAESISDSDLKNIIARTREQENEHGDGFEAFMLGRPLTLDDVPHPKRYE